MIFIIHKTRQQEAVQRIRAEGLNYLARQIPNTENWYIQAESKALAVLFPYLIDYWKEPVWWKEN